MAGNDFNQRFTIEKYILLSFDHKIARGCGSLPSRGSISL